MMKILYDSLKKKERAWSIIFYNSITLYLSNNNTRICNIRVVLVSRPLTTKRRRFFWFIYSFFFFSTKYPYFSFSPGIVSIPNGPCQACQPNVCRASRGCVWFISPRGLLVGPHSPRVSRAFFFPFQLPAKIHPERLYTGVISRCT